MKAKSGVGSESCEWWPSETRDVLFPTRELHDSQVTDTCLGSTGGYGMLNREACENE